MSTLWQFLNMIKFCYAFKSIFSAVLNFDDKMIDSYRAPVFPVLFVLSCKFLCLKNVMYFLYFSNVEVNQTVAEISRFFYF